MSLGELTAIAGGIIVVAVGVNQFINNWFVGVQECSDLAGAPLQASCEGVLEDPLVIQRDGILVLV